MTRGLPALLVLAVAVACSDSTGPAGRTPARVVVNAERVSVGVGDTTRLAATVYDRRDRVLLDSQPAWRSLDPLKARVDAASGLATAVDTGTARIVASLGTLEDTLVLTITRRVATLTLSFASDSVFLGTTAVASAVARDAHGDVIPDAALLWTSSDTARLSARPTTPQSGASAGATVTLTALAEGEAELRVASGAVVARKAVRLTPRELLLGTIGATTVSMGSTHACALDGEGRAWCWGSAGGAALGRGSAGLESDVPQLVVGDHRFTAISAHDRSTCGLTSAGRLLCWGSNSIAPRNSRTPLPVLDSIPTATFAVGLHGQSCALGTDDTVRCWGHNDFYQLGRGPLTSYDTLPLPVAGTQRFRGSVSLGGFGGCAVDADGSPWCWGDGGGVDWPGDRPVPIAPSPAFAQVASYSQGAACGRTAAGEVWCWGVTYTSVDDPGSKVPVRVRDIPAMRRIEGSRDDVCGVGTNGELWCWPQGMVLSAAGIAGTAPQAVRVLPGHTFRDLFVSDRGGVCGIGQGGRILCHGGIIATNL